MSLNGPAVKRQNCIQPAAGTQVSEGEPGDELSVPGLGLQTGIVDGSESGRRGITCRTSIRSGRHGHAVWHAGSRHRNGAAAVRLRIGYRRIVQINAVKHVEELRANLERFSFLNAERTAETQGFRGPPRIPEIAVIG